MVQRAGLCALLLVAVLTPSTPARACGANETQVYHSTKTTWCVDNGVLGTYGTFPSAFFTFGDNVITELVTIFDVPANGVYTFEAGPVTGGAHTGSECCGLGVTVTGDAFYNTAYGAVGFWGFLLSLHETINDWTGQVSNGWPTDFWADHVSAFPNSMDWHIMEALGTQDSDSNLSLAAMAQKARFYPGGDSQDPRVPMFDTIFSLPNMGFAGYSRIFSYIKADQLSWDAVAVAGANPDARRTEYVIAYLSLGAGHSVLPTLQAANVANGQSDGTTADPTYTAQESHIDPIANAHCEIAAAAMAGADESADRAALQSGNYAAVQRGGNCGSCPTECLCNATQTLCVAPWLTDTVGGVDAGVRPGATVDASSTGGSPSSGCGCETRGNGAGGLAWLVPLMIGTFAVTRSRRRR